MISVRETSERFGIRQEIIRNLCHARGQRFAYQLVPNGRFYIDPDRFQDFLRRKQDEGNNKRFHWERIGIN